MWKRKRITHTYVSGISGLTITRYFRTEKEREEFLSWLKQYPWLTRT